MKINFGYTYLQDGGYKQALKIQNEVIARAQNHRNPDLLLHALASRDDIWHRPCYLSEAQNDYATVVDLVESMWVGLEQETDRITYFGPGKPTLCCRIVVLLVTSKQLAKAFSYVERSRSRTYLDVIFRNILELENKPVSDQKLLSNEKVCHSISLPTNERFK